MCNDDDFDDGNFDDDDAAVRDEESDDLGDLELTRPDFDVIDPEDDDEPEPAPGDFWFETDDSGDE